MSWISLVTSIITSAFPSSARARITPPAALAGARVLYANDGRSGRVTFSRGLKSFDMYFEFGGGDTIAIIDIPSRAEWTKRTGFPAASRPDILRFIGESVVRDQTTGGRGRFEVHEEHLSIHSG